MNVKIDTKEKFHEIYLLNQQLSANMTADFEKLLSDLVNQPPHNVVLSLENVEEMDLEFARELATQQAKAYENSKSFVVCSLNENIESMLDKAELLEFINATPTLSEAWDMVQMEEIERELLDGFDEG